MNLPPVSRLLLIATALLGLSATARADTASVDHYVYLSFLPKGSELAQDAKASGLTILRLEERSDRVIVSYRYPDGHTATLGYALRGTNPAARPPAPVVAERRAPPAPEVIYVERPYSTRVYYSDPWYDFWAPVTLGFGIGWVSGYHGGYHGHYHGGYYGRGRGRW